MFLCRTLVFASAKWAIKNRKEVKNEPGRKCHSLPERISRRMAHRNSQDDKFCSHTRW
jgi:hypothetical protein